MADGRLQAKIDTFNREEIPRKNHERTGLIFQIIIRLSLKQKQIYG